MAAPNGFGDSTYVDDKVSPPSERGQSGDLSSNLWNDMRQQGAQKDKAPAQNNEVIDLNSNNIYGLADDACGPKGPKTDINHMDELKAYAEKNFDKLDKDGDGQLSEKELDEAINDPCRTGDDKVAVELLQKYRSDLEDLHDDEFGIENDGITKADLNEFGRKAQDDKEAMDMYGMAKEKMDKLDGNNDGFLDKDELDKAIKAADPKSEDYKTLTKMKEQYDDLQSKSNDEWGFESNGITKEDLLRNAMEKSYDDDALYMRLSGDLMRNWLDKQEKIYPDLTIDHSK